VVIIAQLAPGGSARRGYQKQGFPHARANPAVPDRIRKLIDDQLETRYQQQRYECCAQDSIAERYCHRDHETCLARGLEDITIVATGMLHDGKPMPEK
jgi:hypothetical protein